MTKYDIAEYYKIIAKRMIPYIQGRRLSLVVCPKMTNDDCFYRKNVKEGKPLGPVATGEDIVAHALRYTIEFHAGFEPDIIVFDLDPDEGMGLEPVRQGVWDLKSILDELGLVSFVKTSGGKGYHVFVPVAAVSDQEVLSNFAKTVAVLMEKKWHARYTSNMRKINRRGKVFIDWIRNGRGATTVVPYSVRAKNLRVSMPISWAELDKTAPDQITTAEAMRRIESDDPWDGFFNVQQGVR